MDSGKFLTDSSNIGTNQPTDAGSSLLCNPSPALQKLVPKMDTSSVVTQNATAIAAEESTFLQRPVMQFVMQHHDLESLLVAMKQAVRYSRLACFYKKFRVLSLQKGNV